MIKLSRRDFSRFTLLAAVGAAVPMSAFAFGGPSGPATIYKKQGAIGELKMNPYKIASLTAIIRNGGYVIQNASVRIIPKEGGQEIAYKVSNSQLLTHGGIPVFGLYPAYKNKVEVEYDRLDHGESKHFKETYTIPTPPVYGPIGTPNFCQKTCSRKVRRSALLHQQHRRKQQHSQCRLEQSGRRCASVVL